MSLPRNGWKLVVVGKIMQSPQSAEEDYIFKTKRFTSFVKCILFKLDDKENAVEGTQGQVHFVLKFNLVGQKEGGFKGKRWFLVGW